MKIPKKPDNNLSKMYATQALLSDIQPPHNQLYSDYLKDKRSNQYSPVKNTI